MVDQHFSFVAILAPLNFHLNVIYLFIKFLNVYLYFLGGGEGERERETETETETERERERERDEFQTGSALSAQSLTQGLNSHTVRS